MTQLLSICMLLTICYVVLIIAYRKGWAMQKEFVMPGNPRPITTISIIIAARNEECSIGKCIESILANDYPRDLFEIVVVDDHSEDATAEVACKYSGKKVRCVRMAHQENKAIRSYKKAAIDAGIRNSTGSLIITTDADCVAPPGWLKNIVAVFEREQPVMIVAPVIYEVDKSVVQRFQLVDFMSMQGITAAAHRLKLGNMSNGANLAFSRDAYMKVEGYKGVDHLASGDDYLLMTKINRVFPGRITYLKSRDAIMSTTPQPDWGSFLQQRIRWASKSGKYNDSRLTAVLVLVYLFNFSILGLFVAAVFLHYLLAVAGIVLLVKAVVEYIFLVPVAKFFRKESVLRDFLWLQPLHVPYVVIAGFLGFAGVYKWKGRVVR